MKKISLDPAALAALNAESPKPIRSPKPLPDKMIQIIRRGLAVTLFGPTMLPTFKSQLLTFSSVAAIKTSWAADHFQRRYRERNT